MTGKERARAAMQYQTPDKVPVQFYYTPVGFYEHGEKLNDLFSTLPGDFEPFRRIPVPVLPASDFDVEGHYHATSTDEWGVQYEYRIFGIAGLPKGYPLADTSCLKSYRFPSPAPVSGPAFDALKQQVALHQREHYYMHYTGALFERMISLRPEEDVLCDMLTDEPDMHLIADKIADYDASLVQQAIALGADGISFGDDYGTETGLIMSPELWRTFLKPRLKRIFAPAVEAGLNIHFHSCGMIKELLPDLKEIGATSVWPQLPAYNTEELASLCRSLHLAVCVHTDRANTMTYGTPAQVRELVLREYETFRMQEGGSWFYVEADNGFPFENLEALINTIREIRG